MARLLYFVCAATVAAAVAVGVRELLREPREAVAPELPATAPGDAVASAGEPVLGAVRELERPAPLEPAAGKPAAPADEGVPRTALASETVTLFDLGLHAQDFALGERWQVGLGRTDEGAAYPNDRISAIEIPAGLQATLFDDVHAQGFKLTLGPGTYDLAPYAFSDRISSIEVSRYGQAAEVSGPDGCVVLYEHRGADLAGRGEVWRLELPRGREEWTFLAARKDFLDDQASTAWVALGFELVLFDGPDVNGIALVLGPGLHELELLGFNDRASSARVRRVRPAAVGSQPLR